MPRAPDSSPAKRKDHHAAAFHSQRELRRQVREPLFPKRSEKRVFPALTRESLDNAQDPKNEVADIENEDQQAEENSEYPSNQRNVRKDL